jgi:ATP-dependent Lon protease
VAIFATSNSTQRLSKPLLSRFTVYEIPEYTYEEFAGRHLTPYFSYLGELCVKVIVNP